MGDLSRNKTDLDRYLWDTIFMIGWNRYTRNLGHQNNP